MQSKAKTYAQVMVEAFDGISEKEAEKKIQRLKELLYKRGDFKQVSKILQEFSKAWKERNGKIATVVSAEPLDEATRKQVEAKLKKQGYAVQERVDATTIGGMALYLGNDYVIDGTIKGKLQRFSKLLQNG